MPGIDLSVKIANLYLSCFWMNASGFLPIPSAYAGFAEYETGASVAKTIDIDERDGNETPNFTQISPDLYANSIGLSGAGVIARREEMAEFYPLKKPFIDSIKPQETPEETARLIELLAGLYDAVELNVSCPNVPDGMKVGQCPRLTESYTRACRDALPEGKPLIVKLTPNVKSIGDIAKAAVAGGAHIISGINTFEAEGDYSEARNKLARPLGGISGSGILETGLEKVGEIYQAVRDDAVPIIGMGGIRDARDAIEYLRRGADAVALGTCLFLDRPREIPTICNPRKIVKEFLKQFKRDVLQEFEKLGVKSPAELKGRHYA